MTLLDREVLLGRTPRELVFILAGAGLSIAEFIRPGHVDWPNLAVYVLATLAFAARFYAARAAAVATCIGAIAQQWPHLRTGDVDLGTLAVLPLAGILLLASSDLVERFERAPSRVRWLPNPWSQFTAAETRTLRWAAYAAGALAGLLHHVSEQLIYTRDAVVWPYACVLALIVALALLSFGRALGLLAVWATSLVVLVLSAPLVVPAEASFAASGLPALVGPDLTLPLNIAAGRLYLLPIALLAAFAAATTTPATLRLLRRTLG